jgi:hypothetical protein
MVLPDENAQGHLMSTEPTYIHLSPGASFPELAYERSRVVVVVDAAVSAEWQRRASRWIIDIGCMYMLTWGVDCTTWDDSVDYAHLEKYDYDYEQIPKDDFVITTWHPDQPLAEAFFFAKENAAHPDFELNRTIILDISKDDRSDQMLRAYIEA